METVTHAALAEGLDPRESFSKSQPGLQIAWDSVSIGVLKRCARKYKLQIVDGWQPKRQGSGQGSSLHLRFGILYHRVLEVYDHMRFEGKPHDEAMKIALRDLAEGCQDEAEPIGVEECDACNTLGPKETCLDCDGTGFVKWEYPRKWWDPNAGLDEDKAKANTKTIMTLFRSAIWYMDQYRDEEATTVKLSNGKPAVELSFRYELGYTFSTGEELLHSGHLDRVVKVGESFYVMDRKTSKNTIAGSSSWGYFAKFTPDNQMSGYSFAGKVALSFPIEGVIIDAVQIAKGFSRFERGFAHRTEGQLLEWREGIFELMERVEGYVRRDYWPMNDTSCDDYGGCIFRGICSKDPKVRDIFLKSDFVKEPWDPLKVRGDI